MFHCGIVILAAGSASRMGRPKQLLELAGVSLLRRCAQTALATRCSPIFVVLGANAPAHQSQLSDLDVTAVVNTDWEKGIGSSIRTGVAAIVDCGVKCDALALLLCDQPMVTASAIDQLVEAFYESGQPICAAAYEGTLGTPAVFSARLFGELLGLGYAQGGKVVIQRHAAEVHAVNIPEAALDIDTEADYQRVATSFPDSIQ